MRDIHDDVTDADGPDAMTLIPGNPSILQLTSSDGRVFRVQEANLCDMLIWLIQNEECAILIDGGYLDLKATIEQLLDLKRRNDHLETHMEQMRQRLGAQEETKS